MIAIRPTSCFTIEELQREEITAVDAVKMLSLLLSNERLGLVGARRPEPGQRIMRRANFFPCYSMNSLS